VAKVKELEVRFDSGRDVLSAYWGYLSDGGLVIPDEGGLAVGDPVSLSILITSASATYSLAGRVVRRDAAAHRAVIAFAPGQPHDMLLTQALADADKVPARRARRFRVDLDARVRDSRNGAHPVPARLVDVSELGCCVRLPRATDVPPLVTGTPVEIRAEPFHVEGRVVWDRADDRGIMFAPPEEARHPEGLSLVRDYLRALAK
jgi:hypothetical protein